MVNPLEDEPLRASILDRLVNPSTIGRFAGRQTLDQLIESVHISLENLLNTRSRLSFWPPELDQLERSVLTYGIPDFAGINMSSPTDRSAFENIVKKAILTHEPRVLKADVELIDNTERLDRTLRFRINALLLASPDPAEVKFDSKVDSTSHRIELRSEL